MSDTTPTTTLKTTDQLPPCIVAVKFDLRQSIEMHGYQQPDEQTLKAMQRAFEACLWYEVENHWSDIVAYSGFSFELACPTQHGEG